MTETQGFAEPVSVAEAQQLAGQQLAAQAAETASAPLDAGPTLEQIQQAQREAVLPYEQGLADAMAQIKALQGQLAGIQAGVTAAQQAAGPPAVEQYANGVAALLKAHADANPDVPAAAFTPALEAATQLKAAATDAVTSRDPSALTDLAATVERWASRGVGKHIDFSSLRADLELLGEAAARLAL